MAKATPLEVLRRGLKALRKRHAARRETLLTQLKAKTIAPEDEEWLDQDGNAADEVQALDLLKKASDYERGYNRLSDKCKAAVQTLREFAGDVVKISQRKRKRMYLFCKV